MRRVVWSLDALEDFEAIVRYIAEDDGGAALRVAEAIERAVADLAALPTGRKGRVSGTYERVLSKLPYIIAYALGNEPKGRETITVLRVIHGARNWPDEGWPQ